MLGQEQSAWKTAFIATKRGHSLPGCSEVQLIICTNRDVVCSLGLVVPADTSAWENAAFQAESAPPAKWQMQAMTLAAGSKSS